MGNTTTIPQNTTTNSSINATTPPPTAEPPVPYYPSKDETIEQIFGTGSLLSIGIIVNILVIICIRLRLRSALYLFLENLAVVDILTSLASGPLWIFGMMLFSTGFTLDLDFKLFSFFCRVSGFVHTSLITVFLNTIIVISVSRLFFLLSPTIYITIFPNNVTNRILLFAVWMYSIALSAPPLNPGIWGEYYRFDTICIPKWSSSGDLSYPLFHTILTLAPAVFCTAAAIVVIIFKKKTRVEPENDARVNQNLAEPEPGNVNLETLYIAAACLVLYFVMWLPMVVIQSDLVTQPQSKLQFDFSHGSNMILLHFMYARGIMHPIIYFVISREMRRAFLFAFTCGKLGSNPQSSTAPVA